MPVKISSQQLQRLRRHSERRILAPRLEVVDSRASDDDEEDDGNSLGTIVGIGSTFRDPEEYDCYGTVFGRHCYDTAITKHYSGEREVIVLWQHGHGTPMGETSRIYADDDGLHVEGIPLAEDPANVMRMAYIRKKIVRGLSIGWLWSDDVRYEVIEDVLDDWGWPVWRYTELPLREWSPVTFAADEDAHVTDVRSLSMMYEQLYAAPQTPADLKRATLRLFEYVGGADQGILDLGQRQDLEAARAKIAEVLSLCERKGEGAIPDNPMKRAAAAPVIQGPGGDTRLEAILASVTGIEQRLASQHSACSCQGRQAEPPPSVVTSSIADTTTVRDDEQQTESQETQEATSADDASADVEPEGAQQPTADDATSDDAPDVDPAVIDQVDRDELTDDDANDELAVADGEPSIEELLEQADELLLSASDNESQDANDNDEDESSIEELLTQADELLAVDHDGDA